ncbi:13474_t:CDS:2, partial [Dentiscutata erythropus]
IRKYTVEEEKIIKELCEDLEKNKVIYLGYSEWASNVQIITKKDGRKAIILADITMDLKSAYWQLNMHPKSQKYTASRFGRFGIYL